MGSRRTWLAKVAVSLNFSVVAGVHEYTKASPQSCPRVGLRSWFLVQRDPAFRIGLRLSGPSPVVSKASKYILNSVVASFEDLNDFIAGGGMTEKVSEETVKTITQEVLVLTRIGLRSRGSQLILPLPSHRVLARPGSVDCGLETLGQELPDVRKPPSPGMVLDTVFGTLTSRSWHRRLPLAGPGVGRHAASWLPRPNTASHVGRQAWSRTSGRHK